MSRFYVYALIDPTTKVPFYIGKGTNERVLNHFRLARGQRLEDGDILVGEDLRFVVDQAKEEGNALVLQRINELSQDGYDVSDVARVISWSPDEAGAFAVEALLIKTVYGPDNLLNAVAGQHAERFRIARDWSFLSGFDDRVHLGLRTTPAANLPNYVYVLRDPDTAEVFYVGKGTDARLLEHFRLAEEIHTEHATGRIARIQALIRKGYIPRDIGKVVAHLETDDLAFQVETILIKFVYGLTDLENVRMGHASLRTRPKDHWELLERFDLPRIINPSKPQDRAWLREMMIHEGMDIPLNVIAVEVNRVLQENSIQILNWDPVNILDAGGLGIEASVPVGDLLEAIRIKVFTYRTKVQIELRPRSVVQRNWIRAKFERWGKTELLRGGERVFIPPTWKKSANLAETCDSAVERVMLLLQIVLSRDMENLNDDAKSILNVPSISITKSATEIGATDPASALGAEIETPQHAMLERSEFVPPLIDDANLEQLETLGNGGDHAAIVADERLSNVRDEFPDLHFGSQYKIQKDTPAMRALVLQDNANFGAYIVVMGCKRGLQAEIRACTDMQKLGMRAHFANLNAEDKVRNDAVFIPRIWKGKMADLAHALLRISSLLVIMQCGNIDDLDDSHRDLLQ